MKPPNDNVYAPLLWAIKKFVLISSDKAVNPAKVMGASKHLTEMVCRALQHVSATRFEMVRLGTVPGSTGRRPEIPRTDRPWRFGDVNAPGHHALSPADS